MDDSQEDRHDVPSPPAAVSPGDGGMAQVDPDAATRFHDADTRHMLHELIGTVGGLVETVRRIDVRLDQDSRRLDAAVASGNEIKEKLDALAPQLADALAFIKHGVPNVATKADVEGLKVDIASRPTRRQSIFDLIAFIGFVGVLVGLTLHFAK